MKFGVGHAYWGNTGACDIEKYKRVAKKLADFGFDMFEVTAAHIYHMSEKELAELDAVAREYGLTLSTNSGPAKEYDSSTSHRSSGTWRPFIPRFWQALFIPSGPAISLIPIKRQPGSTASR